MEKVPLGAFSVNVKCQTSRMFVSSSTLVRPPARLRPLRRGPGPWRRLGARDGELRAARAELAPGLRHLLPARGLLHQADHTTGEQWACNSLGLEPWAFDDCLIILFWWIYTNNKWSTVIICPPAAPQRVRGQGGARALRHAVWRLGAVAGPSLLHRGLRLLGGLQVGGTPRHCSWCVAPTLRNDNENTRWLPHNIRHVSEVTGDQVNR